MISPGPGLCHGDYALEEKAGHISYTLASGLSTDLVVCGARRTYSSFHSRETRGKNPNYVQTHCYFTSVFYCSMIQAKALTS
jgi:hypothetical protein